MTQEGNAPAGDFVRRAAEFRPRQRRRQGIQIHKFISMQADARFRSEHATYSLIDSLGRQTAGFCRFFE